MRTARTDSASDGLRLGQRPDDGIREEPLGVGLRLARQSGEDRQPRPRHRERKPALLHPVHRHHERAEFAGGHVLDLVDEKHDAHLPVGGGLRHGGEQFDQVELQVTRVRQTGRRRELDSDVAEFHLDRADEVPQPRESAADLLLGALHPVELEKRHPERGGEHLPERPVLRRLQIHGKDVPLPLGHMHDFVEQHGLPDAAQTGEQDALHRTAERQPP